MKFYRKPKVTITCLILCLLALRASWWQWDRHVEKKAYIAKMQERLAHPREDFLSWKKEHEEQWVDQAPYRKFSLSGEYLFDQEIVLRNRSHEGEKGVYVLTPMRLDGSKDVALVLRGFLPLKYASQEARKIFQKDTRADIIALAKESNPPRFFLSPADAPTGKDKPWVDSFQRVDISHIKKQMPFGLLPVYFEIMGNAQDDTDKAQKLEQQIVRSDSSREDIFIPGKDMQGKVSLGELKSGIKYPIPVFDSVIPPGRHFGYVFEWIIIAGIILGIGVLAQLRP
jgi:cytochrome oxidase assembly protein ShyY1